MNARICSRHFVSGAPANLFDDTNVDWVPSVKLGVDRQERDVEQVSERHERRMNRRRTSLATRQDVQVQVSQNSVME